MSDNNEFILKNIEIKDFRRFKNISHLEEDFRRFNLIYGWNYSGKTTLSRIFANFDGKIKEDKIIAEGEYFLIKNNNEKLSQEDSDKLVVHTFNSDYIKNNIFFESETLKNIIVVAEKADEIVNQIKDLEKEKEIINTNIKQYREEEKKYSSEIADCKKVCAKDILDATAQGRFTASNLPEVEKRLDKTNLEQYILENDNIAALSKTIKSQNDYKPLGLLPIVMDYNTDELNILLQKAVTPSIVLNELQAKHADNWVKEGVNLHKSEKKCLFCGAELSNDKLNEIDKIFQSEFNNLGSSLEEIKTFYNKINIDRPIAATISDCYRDDYILQEQILIQSIKKFNIKLQAIQKIIDAKLKKRNIKMNTNISLNKNRNELMNTIEKINSMIIKHNNFVENEKQEKQKIKLQIENHYVAMLLKSPNYIDAIKKENDSKENHKKSLDDLKLKLSDINNLKAQISDTHKGAALINHYLSILFLGQPTINLQVEKSVDENGKEVDVTRLYRGEHLANDLSDGEKTSIAFAHYLAKIDKSIAEGNANKEVLFIDDPISSLDHNHIYSVSIIISNLREKFNQVFVSTHNFELYRLLSIPCITNDKTDKNGKVIVARDRFYYIRREGDNSVICKIPKALIEFKTEYNFLFYNLKEFLANPTEENIFLIAHCARRFLEIYLSCKYPNTKKLDQKLKDFAKDNEIDDIELIIIYKIVNDESHTHSEKSFDKSFMTDAIKKIFYLLEYYDKHHYDCLHDSAKEKNFVSINN